MCRISLRALQSLRSLRETCARTFARGPFYSGGRSGRSASRLVASIHRRDAEDAEPRRDIRLAREGSFETMTGASRSGRDSLRHSAISASLR